MNIPHLSDSGLLMLHDGVQRAFKEDESEHDPAKKVYGVREYADWRGWADALEAELDKRGLVYSKIPW